MKTSHKSISAFDIIKVGIGPSSSHTMGPWIAAQLFIDFIEENCPLDEVDNIVINLYGSLALTGIGHGTDIAVYMGLSGEDFESIDTTTITDKVATIHSDKSIILGGKHKIVFNPQKDLVFHMNENLEKHANGIAFIAVLKDQSIITEKYYSVGGGFVATDTDNTISETLVKTQYPCHKGADILHYCDQLSIKISDLVLINESAWRTPQETKTHALHIWNEIQDCIYRGVTSKGILPGGLSVKRRAADINTGLLNNNIFKNKEEWLILIYKSSRDFPSVNKWISCFALAVNEENANFGRIVTAPTNGAAGVIPAVLMYAHCFLNASQDDIIRFLLTAGEIGTLFKKNATISAAMGGCQAEIGVSSSMAAAGLTEIMGGSPGQVLMAAEIAMEHHLGMTCDPIGGLVQIPCIERNTMGSIKAITAANIAMESNPEFAKVSLDEVIQTMWETAQDMNHKYKETAKGGLAIAVSVVAC